MFKKKKIKESLNFFIRSKYTLDFFKCDECRHIWNPCGDEIDCPKCNSYKIRIKTNKDSKKKN